MDIHKKQTVLRDEIMEYRITKAMQGYAFMGVNCIEGAKGQSSLEKKDQMQTIPIRDIFTEETGHQEWLILVTVRFQMWDYSGTYRHHFERVAQTIFIST